MIGNITNAIRILEKKRNLSVNLSKNLPPGELLTDKFKYVTSPVINFVAKLYSGNPTIINIVGNDNVVYGTFSLDTVNESVSSGLITNLPPALKYDVVSGDGNFQIICSPSANTLAQELIPGGDDVIPAPQTLYFGGLSVKENLQNTDFIAGYDSITDSGIRNPVPSIPNISRAVVTFTTNTTLLATDSGKAITNNGASASRTWTLPAATVGRLYEIRNDTDAYTLTLQPASGERIGTGAINKFLRLLNRGSLVLVCRFAGRWEVTEDSAITELQA